MVANRHITKIVIVLISFALIVSLVTVVFAEQVVEALGGKNVALEYEFKLFDTNEIIDIDIIIDSDEWDEMLENAILEEYHCCDVVINGTSFSTVGIRPKGNTSLTAIANDPNTDRYSFKLEFDQYVKKQTCWGLDKLVLNNSYADYTYMKESLIFDMYKYLGADASLYNYAKISVNGEYWGVYLALEAVEDSFLLRNYGTSCGVLYKPDSMDINNQIGNKAGDLKGSPNSNPVPGDKKVGNPNGSNVDSHEISGIAGKDFPPDHSSGGFQTGSGGANLNYTDDNLDSYSSIWDSKINKSSEKDHKRVITALKNISEGNNLESYMDTDNLLKYAAVHIFSVNDDSLSGNMAHNYYLYEDNGQINILPWDYNLALGGMNSDSATDMINDAIEMPFSATQFFDAMLADGEYHDLYYQYLTQLTDDYVHSGAFDNFYNRTRSLIDALVKSDPTAFCSYEEYTTAADTLYNVVQLRADSIEGQINGSIPSSKSEQLADTSALIDASDIDLKSMGSMFNSGSADGGGFKRDELAKGFSDEQINDDSMTEQRIPQESNDTANNGADLPDALDDPPFAEGQMPGNFDPSTFEGGNSEIEFPAGPNSASRSDTGKNIIIYSICLVMLIGTLIFASLYHRKR